MPTWNQYFPLVKNSTFPMFLRILRVRFSVSFKRKGTSCHHPDFFCQKEYNIGMWVLFPLLFFKGMYLFVCFLIKVSVLSTRAKLELESCTAHSCAADDIKGYCDYLGVTGFTICSTSSCSMSGNIHLTSG